MMLHLRRPQPTLVTIVLLQLVTLAFLYHWCIMQRTHTPHASLQQHPPPPPPPLQSLTRGKVHVLLVSSWRSGSSFLGQVFSQNPSVFYLPEPAWHVWKTLHEYGARVLRMAVRDLLWQVLKCDMSVMDSYLPPKSKASKLFMWSHSRALCSPPVCSLTPPGGFSNQTECERRCKSANMSDAMDTCLKHSHVALKTVRIFELESLYPLLRDPTLDLRIVHLVRDPRAVWRSRRSLGLDLVRDNGVVLGHRDLERLEAEYHVMEAVCQSQVRIHQTAMRDPPDFLRGRYKMVRYEDVAEDPLGQVEDIYRFAGLEMTRRMQLWTFRATHVSVEAKDRFDTSSRNAKDVSQAWRTSLGHDQVIRVQRVCKDAMSLLGYRTVDSVLDQRDLERDVVLPRELNRLGGMAPIADVHEKEESTKD